MNNIRLDKILSNGGLGSRKEIKEMVKKGRIKVDGNIINDSGMHIDILKNSIEINSQKFHYREHIYLMLNKPSGILTATKDAKVKTILDLIDSKYKNYDLSSAGRLDKDTEGLILLTNNGTLIHKILSPKNHIPKKYFVKFKGEMSKKDIETFEQGVILEDEYKTMGAQIEAVDQNKPDECIITIYEGKYHQVKRMFKALGKEVTYLKRLSIGELELDKELDVGQYRELTDKEIIKLEKYYKGDVENGC